MIERLLTSLIDTSLLLLGGLDLLLLFAANEIGYRVGLRRIRSRPAHESDAAGIGTITAGMLGLLAFTLSLTINIAQNRFELRRALVSQDANAIEAAWLRSKLVVGEQGPVISALIEEFAQSELAYVTANDFAIEPRLLDQKQLLRMKIWQQMQSLSHDQASNSTTALASALVEMFNVARSERFAFESRVPENMSWMLMAGSLLAIGAMGYHLGTSGSRHTLLTCLLLVMWAGGISLIADLNRPRSGMIRVDPAPLAWIIRDFSEPH